MTSSFQLSAPYKVGAKPFSGYWAPRAHLAALTASPATNRPKGRLPEMPDSAMTKIGSLPPCAILYTSFLSTRLRAWGNTSNFTPHVNGNVSYFPGNFGVAFVRFRMRLLLEREVIHAIRWPTSPDRSSESSSAAATGSCQAPQQRRR